MLMATPTHSPTTQPTAAQTLAHFCAGLDYEALPTVVVERAKHFFIDYIAIALHASALDSSRPVRALAAARPIPGGATLLGRPDPVHATWAALANGMAAHSMELDDTFLPGSIHNSPSSFPLPWRWRKSVAPAGNASSPPSSLGSRLLAVSPPRSSRR
jgi:2-methylcitrate dehydratase PrpD